jgi:hypothetical protein
MFEALVPLLEAATPLLDHLANLAPEEALVALAFVLKILEA